MPRTPHLDRPPVRPPPAGACLAPARAPQKLKKKKSKSNKNNNFFSESGSGSFGHATPTSGATTVSPKETPKTSAKAEGKTEADAKAEKTKKAPLDKTQQSHRAKTRWKQAAKAALVESTTHEIVSAFQELGAAAKAREQRLQKAIEQNRRNDRKIVPQLTFAEQNWYETGRAQSPRSVLPGAKAAEDMNEKVLVAVVGSQRGLCLVLGPRDGGWGGWGGVWGGEKFCVPKPGLSFQNFIFPQRKFFWVLGGRVVWPGGGGGGHLISPPPPLRG